MRRKITSIVFYGALWGMAEATLGFGLHLLRRVAPIPGLTGYVLFPIGFLIMLAAFRSTGRSSAAFHVAAVAAGLKLATGFLPGVDWIFVVNPALAILFEGLVVFLAVKLLSFGKSASRVIPASAVTRGCDTIPASVTATARDTPPASVTAGAYAIFAAFSAAISWRALFLLSILLLPLHAGILNKGTSAILQFLFLESAVNGLVIGLALWLNAGIVKPLRISGSRGRQGTEISRRYTSPAWSFSVLFAVAGIELFLGYFG